MTGERNFLAKAKERCWKIYHTYYKKSQYKSHEDRYREAIINFLTPDTCLLDAGCGSEMVHIRDLSPKIRLAIGIDIDQIKPNISR